jgi:hypothetical protein
MFASLGSLGAALLSTMSKNPSLLSKIIMPKSHVYGHLHVDDRVRVVRTSSYTVMYDILRGTDERVSALLEKSDEMMSALFNTSNAELEPLLVETLKLSLKVILGSFFPITSLYLMSINWHNYGSFRYYGSHATEGMSYKSGGRMYHDLGYLSLVHQIFRKTEAIRKGGKLSKNGRSRGHTSKVRSCGNLRRAN